jgi:hypothetical protein
MSEQAEPAKALGRLSSMQQGAGAARVLERRRRARDQFLAWPAVAPPGLVINKVLIPRLADEHHTRRARRAGPQHDEMTAMVGADLTGAPRRIGDDNRRGGPRQVRWGPALRGGGEGCAATGREGLDGSDGITH